MRVINPVQDGTFARNSIAYLGSDAEASMLACLPHVRRTRKCMVSNPSGFEIRRHELGSPNDFYGMAYDDTYIYGVGKKNVYL